MEYRKLGRTGLQVSRLVFGGGYVGGLLLHQTDPVKRAALDRALEAGMNWIDTAPLYGDGESETAIGELLPHLDPPPQISTKVMLMPGRLSGDIPGQIERGLHQSLERLQLPAVELLQLHNPISTHPSDQAVDPSQVLGVGGIADAMDRLREQGLARYIGVTALGESDSICRVLKSGRFDTAQVYYNMINPSAARRMPPSWPGHHFTGVLECCRDNDIGVMNIRTYAAGVLATTERHGREIQIVDHADITTEERRADRVFQKLGDLHGTPAQTALRYSLANRDIDCVVIGLAVPEHLEEAIAAEEMGPLPESATAMLNQIYDDGFI